MIKILKDELWYYKNFHKYGVLKFILTQIIRIAIFPVLLVLRLYKWVYYDD